MSRRTTYITILIILFVLLIGAGVFFYLRLNPQTNPFSQDADNDIRPQQFFPTIPQQENGDFIVDDNTPIEDIKDPKITIPRIRQISKEPVAGYIAFQKTIEGETIVDPVTEEDIETTDDIVVYQYVERATGHIFETTNKTLSRKRITNTTLPQVYNATFSSDGTNVLLQFIKDTATEIIETFHGTIVIEEKEEEPEVAVVRTASSTESGTSTAPIIVDSANQTTPQEDTDLVFAEGTIEGDFLKEEMHNLTTSPDKSQIIYIGKNNSDYSIVTANFDGSNAKSIYNTPISEWSIDWISNSLVVLTTQADSRTNGHVFYFNPTSGEMRNIGTAPGISTLTNPTGEYILISSGGERGTSLDTIIYNTTNNTSEPAQIATLAEKCVWSTKIPTDVYCGVPYSSQLANYPEDWYQGKVNFQDIVWKIDVSTNETDIVIDVERDTDQEIDVYKPQLSDNEEYFMFVNKYDLSLWSYEL